MGERRAVERWIAWVRLGGFGVAFLQVVLLPDAYPNRRYELAAWITTGILALGAVVFFWLSRRPMSAYGTVENDTSS